MIRDFADLLDHVPGKRRGDQEDEAALVLSDGRVRLATAE
jgi:hypothetical protein